VPHTEPTPAVFAEIPLNSNRVKEVDVNLLTKMLVPPFINFLVSEKGLIIKKLLFKKFN